MGELQTGGVRMVPVHGRQFKVWTKRVGRGSSVILTLHGGPGSTHEYFECFEDFLPQRGIEFYYYDQLGSHYSDQPDDPSLWTAERFRDEVEEVRCGLGLENFILYGQSWGGILAIEYALAYPQHLKALIISNMTASLSSYAAYLNQLRRRLPVELLDVMEIHEARGDYSAPEYQKLVRQIYSQYLCRTNPWPEPLARTFRHTNFQVYNTMQGPNEFVVTGNLRDWDRWADLQHIRIPTLLLAGEHDTVSPADIAEMARRIPNSRVAIVPGGSHCTMWDAQEPYFDALVRFVADVESRAFAASI